MSAPRILLESEKFMVLDKPSGWVVNDAKTTKAPTIQGWLNKKFEFAGEVDRAGIVHRLDKETSGVLIVAKSSEAMAGLQAQFREREVGKEYVALVHGELKKSSGSVDAPVGRLPWNRERFGVFQGGREAYTEYSLEKVYKGEGERYSLVRAKPRTGRTHQIRVHMKYLGNPVVGDSFYAGRKTARKDRVWCPRLFLHAAKIVFADPETGEQVKVESGLPEELKDALTHLELVA